MSSKTDFAVKLVLVLFITLLSFSIGTFVGKQYSDNQHQLALLEPNSKTNGEAKREVASVAGEEGTDVKKSAMSDEDIAKLAEEFVADETESPAKEAKEGGHEAAEGKVTANEHGTAEHAEHGKETAKENKKEEHTVAKNEKAPAHKIEASNVAKELATNEKATEEKSEAKTIAKSDRIPSSLPKNVAQYTVGKFTVQVAAYTSEGEAQKMASDLKKKGYSAFYIPAAVKGQTYYRVSVGQFASQKEAQSYRSELMEKAKVSAAIVQKITE